MSVASKQKNWPRRFAMHTQMVVARGVAGPRYAHCAHVQIPLAEVHQRCLSVYNGKLKKNRLNHSDCQLQVAHASARVTTKNARETAHHIQPSARGNTIQLIVHWVKFVFLLDCIQLISSCNNGREMVLGEERGSRLCLPPTFRPSPVHFLSTLDVPSCRWHAFQSWTKCQPKETEGPRQLFFNKSQGLSKGSLFLSVTKRPGSLPPSSPTVPERLKRKTDEEPPQPL